MSETVERVATLETQMDTLLEKVNRIEQDTSSIKESLNRQRGFVAGMLTILTPLWGILLLAGHEAWKWLQESTH